MPFGMSSGAACPEFVGSAEKLMEVEMTFRNSSLSCIGASGIGSIVAIAILLGANLAYSQTANNETTNRHNGAPDSFADLAEKVEPAVIGVTSRSVATERALPEQFRFGAPGQRAPKREAPQADGSDAGQAPAQAIAIGSGFFISPDGYAVTNSHVMEDSDTAQVRTSDNKVYQARLIGNDPLSDLALIKVDGRSDFSYQARLIGNDPLSDLALIKVDGRSDFSYVKLADQPPRVGDWVLTVGNPFGLKGTVTAGIVSAREREIAIGPTEGFIQIDAPINSGDSGGPSFNTAGDVIGVNSMIFSPSGGSSGVAFAIPADTVKTVIPQLKEKGVVTRGSMGAQVQSVTPEIADSLGENNLHGAIVSSVQGNGPAAKAGIRSGDVITSVAGEPVKSANELTKKIHGMAPGSSVTLATVRQGKQGSANVTLSQLPNQAKAAPGSPR
jgi:serine protease Do